jgi:sugar/nucleoside kinase (ribokinase family)
MIKLVVVGSITEDLILMPKQKEKQSIGGTPIYVTAAAKALGESVGIVSKVGTDFQVKNLKLIQNLGADLNGFQISGKTSMRFKNKYNTKGYRSQELLSISSEKINFNDIPRVYLDIPWIHLGPVYHEIESDFIYEAYQNYEFVSLDVQGFIRSTKGSNGKVIHKPWNNFEELIPHLSLLKVDDFELKSMVGTTKLNKAIDTVLATGLNHLVITRAHQGAIIYQAGKRHDIPALPTKVVDETGAGDTFITAYIFEYLKTKDCYYAGLIAASTAAHNIATPGPLVNYSREDIVNKITTNIPDFKEK